MWSGDWEGVFGIMNEFVVTEMNHNLNQGGGEGVDICE